MSEHLKIMRPKKIVVEIEMPDGAPLLTLETDTITREKMSAIIKAGENKRVDGNVLYEQVAVIFGGKKEDYYKIDDVRVVKQIIDFVTEQIKNPE